MLFFPLGVYHCNRNKNRAGAILHDWHLYRCNGNHTPGLPRKDQPLSGVLGLKGPGKFNFTCPDLKIHILSLFQS